MKKLIKVIAVLSVCAFSPGYSVGQENDTFSIKVELKDSINTTTLDSVINTLYHIGFTVEDSFQYYHW